MQESILEFEKKIYVKCVHMFTVADEIVTNLIQTYILNFGKCVGLKQYAFASSL